MTSRWWTYVSEHGGENQTEIARRTELSAASVNRWKTQGSTPSPENVARFAIAYGRPVLEALVAAGHITEEQAGVQVTRVDLATLSTEDIMAELGRRLPTVEPVVTVARATVTVPPRPRAAASRRTTPESHGQAPL
jgi:transcriptional regulator with XRE-family HTH domain